MFEIIDPLSVTRPFGLVPAVAMPASPVPVAIDDPEEEDDDSVDLDPRRLVEPIQPANDFDEDDFDDDFDDDFEEEFDEGEEFDDSSETEPNGSETDNGVIPDEFDDE